MYIDLYCTHTLMTADTTERTAQEKNLFAAMLNGQLL